MSKIERWKTNRKVCRSHRSSAGFSRASGLLVLLLVFGCTATPHSNVASRNGQKLFARPLQVKSSETFNSSNGDDRLQVQLESKDAVQHDREPQSTHTSHQLTVVSFKANQSQTTGLNEGLPTFAPLLQDGTQTIDKLSSLEAIAVSQNPRLRRLAEEHQAAKAKVDYVDGLPDPTVAANIFAAPIETASGSQRANVTVAQMIPWLDRLDAQAQQACFEAMEVQQRYAAEKLRVVADLHTLWNRLYVIEKQSQINEANQQLLERLIEVATAQIATGNATQSDVLAGTLEYSKLEEQLVSLRQQRGSVSAKINQVLGRDSQIPISPPTELHISLPQWDHSMLKQMAFQHQPEIQAARIRTQATRWGLEVALLKRRPDVSVNASWFAIDNNRPASTVVDVGDDAWSVGASVSIPLWDRKYNAIEQEARWKHSASYASVEETQNRYDSALQDLWEQAKAADQTAKLYQDTILPQAQATLDSDQQSYVNGTVDFDRIIADVRNVLTLETGYHRSVGQLGTAIARIEQAVGTSLTALPE